MARLRESLWDIVETNRPVTVRQVFYLAVAAGLVEKTQSEYSSAVGRLLLQMRRDGEVPYTWITDNTRWMMKAQSYSSLEEALRLTAETYRRALWADSPVHVEVWCEKDAISGVLYDVTDDWDVPLMPARGFSSETFLYNAGAQIEALRKPTWIYYFGDYDGAGRHISRKIEEGLQRFAPSVPITFEQVAVLPNQIRRWRLPTRPPKFKSDKGFTRCVEVDAIPPDRLRQLVRECIEHHVDHHQVEVLRVAEQSEREIAEKIAETAGTW